jgi:hypothetical protein
MISSAEIKTTWYPSGACDIAGQELCETALHHQNSGSSGSEGRGGRDPLVRLKQTTSGFGDICLSWNRASILARLGLAYMSLRTDRRWLPEELTNNQAKSTRPGKILRLAACWCPVFSRTPGFACVVRLSGWETIFLLGGRVPDL